MFGKGAMSKGEAMNSLGDLIARTLYVRGLSQREASIRAEMAHSTLSKIINGKTKEIKNSTLIRLSEVLQIPVHELQDAHNADLYAARAELEQDEDYQRLVARTPKDKLEQVLNNIRAKAEDDPDLSAQLETWLRRRR